MVARVLGVGCGTASVLTGLAILGIANGPAGPDPRTDSGFGALFMLPFTLVRPLLPPIAWPLIVLGVMIVAIGLIPWPRARP